MHLVATDACGRIITAVELAADGQEVYIGRNPAGAMAVPGGAAVVATGMADRRVSELHSRGWRDGTHLRLVKLPSGRNPFVDVSREQRIPLPDALVVAPEGGFGIGVLGAIRFYWVEDVRKLPVANEQLQTISVPPDWGAAFGGRVAAAEMSVILDALLQDLPRALSGWHDAGELFSSAAEFLRRFLGGGHRLHVDFLTLDASAVPLAWSRLSSPSVPSAGVDYRPSRTLLGLLAGSAEAARGEARLVKHCETAIGEAEQLSLGYRYGWILALPVGLPGANGFEECRVEGRPVVLYVESGPDTGHRAEACLPFFRLIGSLVTSLLTARERQLQSDRMGRFFSRKVRSLLSRGEPHIRPENRECTVLFCDRRAFSKTAEAAEFGPDAAEADVNRLRQLEDNQELLGRVVRVVEETGGCVSDFVGDGLLAFWGWPDDPSRGHEQHAARAVSAALRIAAELHDRVQASGGRRVFPLRIGINTGRVVVGQVGPEGHAKLSVFGSAVNVGSRLEGLAKAFFTPVILSEATVSALLNAPQVENPPLLRRLCRIIPAGMSRACSIHELVLPVALGGSGITAEHAAQYERGLDHFENQRWEQCLRELESLRNDPPAIQIRRRAEDYLLGQAAVPHPWSGEIRAESK